MPDPTRPDPFFHATAVILAGGKSNRMGQDKRFLPAGDGPLIQQVTETLRPHFSHMLLVAPDADRLAFLAIPVIGDIQAGAGPLAGIASALQVIETDLAFVCACDIPQPPLGMIQQLYDAVQGHDCAAPRHANGNIESLFAFFRKAMEPQAVSALRSGSRRVHELITNARTAYVPMDETLLQNVNTPADYHAILGRTGETPPS